MERSTRLFPNQSCYAQAIKQHCARPIAKLYGDQCGGCNMNIPQASLRAFKSGAKMIECENCGRMLIQL